MNRRTTPFNSRILPFLIVISFRIVNALLVTTFFSPDEYFQSLEIAHRYVFGFGQVTWEWREENAIRSFFHPFVMFVPWFWLVRQAETYFSHAIGFTFFRTLVITGPKIICGICAGIHDIFMISLADNFGISYDDMMFCILSDWFHFYSLVRSFSNSIEACITAVALFYWFIQGDKSFSKFMVAVAVSCLVRPTSAILWVYPALDRVFMKGNNMMVKKVLVTLVIGIAAIVMMLFCDSLWYGKGRFTLVNFLTFNVVKGLSVFYGEHPWHWYLSQGIPVITGSFLPLVLNGIWMTVMAGKSSTKSSESFKQQQQHEHEHLLKKILNFILIPLFVYSIQGHKEFRFIHPLLSVLLLFAAFAIGKVQKGRLYIILALLVTNVPVAWYMSRVHQRGVIDIMNPISELQFGDKGFLLMPCHSTPMASHHHNPMLTLNYLTCDPPLSDQNYIDESSLFYKDPELFMRENFDSDSDIERFHWPQFFVMFEPLLPILQNFLEDKEYQECYRIFNSHFHDDSRRYGSVIVFCRKVD